MSPSNIPTPGEPTSPIPESFMEGVRSRIYHGHWNCNKPSQMLHHFKANLAEADLTNIKFHLIRHSVASILLQQNTHPKLVAELLGHSSVNLTLSTYSHITNPMNRVIADTLDKAISQ